MLEDFLDARRDDIMKDVWERADANLLSDPDGAVEELVSKYRLKQLYVFADRRRVLLSHDKRGISVKFAVPLGGSLDVVKHVVITRRHELECDVCRYDDLEAGYRPDDPSDVPYMVIEVAVAHYTDTKHINELFDKWHHGIMGHIDVINGDIRAFNDSLPRTVKEAVGDRGNKILHAEEVRAALVGRYQNGEAA